MGLGYQETDRAVIDYDLWFPWAGGPALRGPRVALGAPGTICCIGAAQTFGRFVAEPYPAQLGRLLQRPVLNLGFSGAGPRFFLREPRLVEVLRHAPVVVVQCMSGRSVSAGALRTSNNFGVLEFVSGARMGQKMLAANALAALRAEAGEAAFAAQVAAMQAAWLADYRELLAMIGGRKVFLWMAGQRAPETLDLGRSAVGQFPHFVTRAMAAEVAALCDGSVESVVAPLPPQVLVNDLTRRIEPVFSAEQFPGRAGGNRSLNAYYGTPELHDRATGGLLKWLAENGLWN
jgi:hypothetical protein